MVVFSALLRSGFVDTIAPTKRPQIENYDNSNGSLGLGGAVASFFRRITATADQDEERLDDETRTDVSNSEREGEDIESGPTVDGDIGIVIEHLNHGDDDDASMEEQDDASIEALFVLM